MGPASRPTPLSPACGSRRTLNARRFQYRSDLSRRTCRCAASLSPGARAGAGSVQGLVSDRGDRFRATRRFRDRSFPSLLRAVPHRPETLLHLGLDIQVQSCRLCAFAASTDRLGFPKGSRSVPPPCGISPSRRYGSKIPSPSLAFQPLPRKGQSPFRCMEGAPPV